MSEDRGIGDDCYRSNEKSQEVKLGRWVSKDSGLGLKHDVWSLGMVVLELGVGEGEKFM